MKKIIQQIRKNLVFSKTKIYKYAGTFWFIPCISIVYNKDHFLETGVHTPALSLQIAFLNMSWGCRIQKRYYYEN
jgi:hypothetical protein